MTNLIVTQIGLTKEIYAQSKSTRYTFTHNVNGVTQTDIITEGDRKTLVKFGYDGKIELYFETITKSTKRNIFIYGSVRVCRKLPFNSDINWLPSSKPFNTNAPYLYMICDTEKTRDNCYGKIKKQAELDDIKTTHRCAKIEFKIEMNQYCNKQVTE